MLLNMKCPPITKFLIFCFYLLSSLAEANAINNCFSFIPYATNGSFVQLPEDKKFCFHYSEKITHMSTNHLGGRVIRGNQFKDEIIAFGESQLLGLDVSDNKKSAKHELSELFSSAPLTIYAAPNNGPYEVINFLNQNKKILHKKIIVTFSFSTDIYRILNYWNPENFVALKDYQLDEILENPFKYRLIVFKNLLLNKNFTITRYDNKKMQDLFLNSDQNEFYNNLTKYFDELNETATNIDIEIDFIVTHPYWVYSIDKKNNKLLLDKALNNKVEKLICNSFQSKKNISKILISQVPETLQLNDLTFDKRHLKSSKINLKDISEICRI